MVVQAYYNITSDMPTDIMLSVAAENLATKMNVIAEEQHRASLIKPLHVWISRWVSLQNLKKIMFLICGNVSSKCVYIFHPIPVLLAQPATS